jgi:GntR family transcriptional repressor for pyruvate dehydrogenase complex
VSWPKRNRTLTRDVARRIVDAHGRLAALIEARDTAEARRLMEAHVGMIRSRRVAESRGSVCC